LSVSDPIADMLAMLRNGGAAGHEKVDVTPSQVKLEIIKILKTEGFIKNFKKTASEEKQFIRVFLKYDPDHKPVIHGLKRISKPGRRVYSGTKKLPRVFNGYGTLIVSTSGGVITGRKATEQQVGGELLCSVW